MRPKGSLPICLFLAVGAWIQPQFNSIVFAASGYADAEMRAMETSDESKLRDLRQEELTQLKIALGRRLAANRQADLYMRLAEIYVETYRAEFLLEGRVHDKRLESGAKDPFIDRTHSKPYLRSAIDACREIIKTGIAFAKMDEVFYFLGFNYGELGDRKQSLHYYEELTRRYPSSPYVAEAYREMGDEAYRSSQFRKAQGYFEQAVKKSSPDALPRILHKLSWSYYRTKQYDRAVEAMKNAVGAANQSGEKFLSLREEALRDMAIFMTEQGKSEDAIEYFKGVAGDKAFYPKLLERLGKQYERNVEPAKATQVYESLLKTNPESDAAFRVRVKLVDLDLRQAHFQGALGRIKGLEFKSFEDADTRVAAQNLKAMIRRTATEKHESFRKKGERPDLEVAEAFYQAYLDTFLAKEDSRAETPEIQMYLAEVKRELGKAQDASALYRKVMEGKDKRYSKEAGALWTASLADAIKKSNQKSNEPNDTENQYLEASDRMKEALGDTPETREASLRAAQLLAGYKGEQNRAIKRLKKIVEEWPKSQQAVTAARLWIQLLAEKAEATYMTSSDADEDLRKTLKEIRSNSQLLAADQEAGAANSGKLKVLLADQEIRIKIHAIARVEKDKDYLAAGKGYEEFAQEANGRDVAEKAFAGALAAYVKVQNTEGLERVSALWLKRYSKSPKAADGIRSAATQLLIAGKYESAQSLFEKEGRDGSDSDSLETAARLAYGMGDLKRAQAAQYAYLDLYRNSPARRRITLSLAASHETGTAEGHDSEAAKIYKFCLAAFPDLEAECASKLGDIFARSGDLAKAKSMYRQASGSHVAKAKAARADANSPYIGYARFQLADFLEKESRFDRMEMPEAKLKKAMSQRLEFLESLNKAYSEAVDAGGPWAIAALDRLAGWVYRLSKEIDAISPPSTLDAAGIARFKKGLSAVSDPLRKKAADAWQEAYSKAIAAEALSPALPAVADQLSDLRKSADLRSQGSKQWRLSGIASDGGADGAAVALLKTREKLSKNPQDASAWLDYGNLILGQGKPKIAQVCYERATALNPKLAGAWNNRAYILLSTEIEEASRATDLAAYAAQAVSYLNEALKQDDFFLPAKANLGAVFNYFRMFSKAKNYWEQVNLKSPVSDSMDGFAVSLQGLGQLAAAEANFEKSNSLGASKNRFAWLYHRAARMSVGGTPESARKCLAEISDLKEASLSGFEKESASRLKTTCEAWQKGMAQ